MRRSVASVAIAPSVAAPRAGSPSNPSMPLTIAATTSSNDTFSPPAVMPSRGTNRFCGVVHIWPEYSDSDIARLRVMPLRSSTESITTLFTPAFSVYTSAREFCSSQSPNSVEPV